jgi:hypothetical protein
MSFDSRKNWGLAVLLLIFIVSLACSGQAQNIPTPPVFVTFTSAHVPPKKTVDRSVPQLLREWADAIQLNDGDELTLKLATGSDPSLMQNIQWVYVLVAPFPTIRDGVTLDELRAAWNGSPFNGQPLLIAESTLGAMKAIWGEPEPGIYTSKASDAKWGWLRYRHIYPSDSEWKYMQEHQKRPETIERVRRFPGVRSWVK